MEKELRIKVGVIAEERAARSRWVDNVWGPVAVVEGGGTTAEGTLMHDGERVHTFFMGCAEICCHRAESEAYLQNLQSSLPGLYVILRRDEEQRRPLSWYVHTVTASPYEAQDYCDTGEEIVGRVAIPAGIGRALQAFVAAYPPEEPPRKRRRQGRRTRRVMAEKEERSGFISRWSRLKREGAADGAAPEVDEDHEATHPVSDGEQTDHPELAVNREAAEAVDIGTLDFSSDFSVFMKKGVPQALKHRALRKLWTASPVLANLDGLNDYEQTDVVRSQGVVSSLWQVGQGYARDAGAVVVASAETDDEPPAGAPPAAEPASDEPAASPDEPADQERG